MADQNEEALSKYLSENGLTHIKWVKCFQNKGIKKPNQIYPLEGDEDVYQSLSLDANPSEKSALRNILKIKAPIDLPEDSIHAELNSVGLEPSYWSGVFEKQLGIKTPQALQYVGGESYDLLLQFLRKPWEKKALRKLLKVESEKSAYKEKLEKQKEKLKQRQDESAEFLKVVRGMEQGFRERLKIPESVWLQDDATLSQAIKKKESRHRNISGALKSGDNDSDVVMITTASGGLALHGVLITTDPNDDTELRESLLRAPEDIQLDGPSHSQHDKIEQFSSKKKEDEFSKRVNMLGYSASVSAKAGYSGIGFEASSSYSKKNEKEETKEHHEEKTYSSTVKYSIMPLASCSFKDRQLQLSHDAVTHLKKIDTALGGSQPIDNECLKFFHKFGSHACKGPLHFGGKYEWKSYTSGFKEAEKRAVQALQSEVISASVGISYGSIAGGSASGSVSNMKGSFSGKYTDVLINQTFLEVTITGGPPDVTGLPDWKNGLVASNRTWYLIDRGTRKVSVWDIIEMNHESDFQNTSFLVKALKQTWHRMNKLDINPPTKDMAIDVQEVMDRVTFWNDSPDKNQFEKQLGELVEKKDIVTKEYLDPQAWATDYLSQSPLQQFLRLVVRVCIKGEFQHSDRLKRSIRRLVEPIDLDITRIFRDQESIRQWLYGTPEINPPMVCMDFISMHKYFELALESMHGGVYDKRMDPGSVILPDLAVKATATVAKAVFCVRSYLHKAGQKYEDCFLTTMLYPLKYDPENNVFLVLLTRNELKYLCEEFQKESKAFFDIKEEKPLQSLQSHLFLLAVQLYEVFYVSEQCLKDHLEYLEQHFGDEIKPEVSSCLVELKSHDYSNLELFKNKLVQGVFVQQRATGVLLDDILPQEVQSKRSVPNELGAPQSLQHKSEEVGGLFSRLHLNEYLPKKLTLSYALQIREDTLEKRKADVDQSKNAAAETNTEPQKSQTQNKMQCSDPLLYSDIILQKIMSFDHRCRLTLTSSSPVSHQSSHSSDSESESESESDEEKIEVLVHPMDGLLALLHCSDNFLRQDLMCRLATCQLAVPLLLPDPITREPTFLLWAMRTIVKEFRVDDGTVSYSGPIIGYEAPIVSFLRIGHHSKSKSHLLNTVINTTEYATFFHWNCEGGRAKRILVNGLVEVSWYLPSNNDNLFPDAISFANLHGDASEHSKQVQFLSEVSRMHFVFLKENDLNDATLEVLKNLSQAPGGITILQFECSASNKILREKLKVKIPKDKFSIVKLYDKNDFEIKTTIQKKILAVVGQKTDLKLEQCKDLAHKCGIAVDEDEPDCITGRKMANKFLTIVEKFKETNHPKKLLVLQSSDLWHKWGAMDKEQYRQTRKGQLSMFDYGALQRKRMDMIRKTQLHNAQNPSPLIASFINSLLKHKGPIAWYYLHWLKLILDDLSRELLPPLHSRYYKKRKELNDIQMQEKRDEVAETICRDEMNKLNIDLINASFGPEHLFREMSQMYEAVISQDDAPLSFKISRFPEIAAQLLVDGFPLELMDGDAAHVPKDWISAVLEKVSDILKITTSNPQLFVLSVLGLQSTGKSTMMNTLFGVQFTVSAGRCTRGAFMQLLPVHESLQKKCGFQYFLIIDTEGLRAPELDALQTQKHDNELATFVIGMANLTIMNIKGEIAGDMDDILQTTVHAFLRMSEVKLRPSCHFVHQNVPAVAAGDKAMMGRFKVKDKLDGMTEEAAKEAGLQARYFNQVIKFDYENDVSFFPSLWTGSPPMAPVNVGYSIEAQVLKHHLINCTKKSLKSRDNSVLRLKQHLEELWKAILQENFLFSFKNTFEIAAFTTLEEKYGDWSWSFKNAMIKWEHESQIKLMSCKIEDLPTIYKDLTELPTAGIDRTESLPQYIGRIYQDLETKMTAFFDESPEQEIISKWKYDTEVRLRTLCGKLQTHAESHCKQLFSSRKIRATAEKKKEKMSVDILERVKELASTLEKERMNDTQLKEMFEQSWIYWITELTASIEKIEGPNVKSEVEKSMTDRLHTYQKLVMQRLSDSVTGKPLEKWGIHLKLRVRRVHLKLSQPSSWGGKFNKFVGAVGSSIDDFLSPAQQETDIILKAVEVYLNKKQGSGENFNPEFPTQLLQELFSNIGKVQCEQFFFTAEYKVDMALTVCGHALHVFVEMADAFRIKHDPSEYIQREMKAHCLKLFMDQYNQIAQEITAAGTLCQQLKTPVRDQVMYELSLAIVSDIRGRKLWIKTKPSLKANILLDMGEKLAQGHRNFSDCGLYLKNVKQSLYYWVKLYTEQHCDEKEQNRSSQISALAMQELNDIMKAVKNRVKSVTRNIPRSEEFHLTDWLTKFHTEVTGVTTEKESPQQKLTEPKAKGTLQLDLSQLCVLGGKQVFKNLDFFTDEVVKGLDSLQSSLKHEFQTMTSSVMQMWEKKPYDTLLEEVAGCTKQCPFCKEQCDHTNAEHSSSVKHSTQHRPHCLGGYRWEKDNTMILDLCTSLVHGDYSFCNSDTNDQWRPYKEYTKVYPDWSIPDDTSITASLYWKWLVGNYPTEIEELFGRSKTTIHDEWKALKWPKVKEWLKKEYRL